MWIEKKYMFFKSFIRKSFSIALKGRNKIFMGEISFSKNQLSTKYTNFDEWKGRGEKIYVNFLLLLLYRLSHTKTCQRFSLGTSISGRGGGFSGHFLFSLFLSPGYLLCFFGFLLLFFIIMVLSNNATKICEITSKLVVLW